MKKNISLILMLCAGISFISAFPSLDGRAVVADDSVFPPGLFAKTVGYLPGDTISVTNPSNGQNIEILVIGSLDPSKGVAILLSPEAAEILHIKKESNMLVKLTKRSGELDKNVTGTCVLTQAKDVENKLENTEVVEAKTDEIAEVSEETLVEEISVEEASATEDIAEVPTEEIVELSEKDEVVDSIQDEEVTETDVPLDSIQDEQTEEVVEVVEEEIPEDNNATDEPKEIAESVVEDEIPEDETDETPEEVAEVVDDDVPVEEVEELEEIAEVIEEEEIPEEVEEEIVSESEGESTESSVEEVADEAESEDEFEAIVLVPADENPPVVEETEEEIIEEEPIVEKTPVEVTVKVGKTSKNVNYVKQLEKGKFYIQIAAYTKAENVDSVVERYGKKYPISIEQKNNKNIVLIGPLSVDEYGTVLERFKSFGFKDCFLRKGK